MPTAVPSGSIDATKMEHPNAAPPPANAADKESSCKENPNAIGTSRVLIADPIKSRKIGTLQFADTLPLQDHAPTEDRRRQVPAAIDPVARRRRQAKR